MENEAQQSVGCPKCGREFKNPVALRMHDIRKHQGRGWDTSQNFGPKQSNEERLAKKRAYNRKWRARRGMGTNPTLWKENKGSIKPTWSPERRAKFNSTWRSKNSRKNKATLKKFQPIVYPRPSGDEIVAAEKVAAVRTPDHCPHCGENIRAWRYEP